MQSNPSSRVLAGPAYARVHASPRLLLVLAFALALAAAPFAKVARAEDDAFTTLLKSVSKMDQSVAGGNVGKALDVASPVAQDTIRKVQRDLAELGYDPGPADGAMGSRTRSAIRAFQSDRGLASDGIVNTALLDQLAKARAEAPQGSPRGGTAETQRPRSAGICQSYVGQTVAPQPFDAAVARFANLTPKGEFETAAQYDARKAAVLGDGPIGPIIIAKEPEDRKFFEYDADAQKLRIISYAFHISDIASLTGSGPLDWSVFAVVISKDDRILGTYDASNAYGTTVQVTKIQRLTKVIRTSGNTYELDREFFREVRQIDGLPVVGELTLSPSEAASLKPTIKIAFVVTPRDPFFSTGSTRVHDPTFQDPRDVTEDFSLLSAYIQCGLLMDGENKVLQAYPTS
jgi:peptidoglycan hydrolase-like protein with peptidoglycan-binding domain